MNQGIVVAVALVIGPIIGWFLTVGVCSLPFLRFNVACGHNAFIWLLFTVPLGIAASGFLTYRLLRQWRKSRK